MGDFLNSFEETFWSRIETLGAVNRFYRQGYNQEIEIAYNKFDLLTREDVEAIVELFKSDITATFSLLERERDMVCYTCNNLKIKTKGILTCRDLYKILEPIVREKNIAITCEEEEGFCLTAEGNRYFELEEPSIELLKMRIEGRFK